MAPRKFFHREMNVNLLGNFNPKIIVPSWLAAKGLIREGESESADLELITNDISIFKLEWCSVNVTDERFIAQTFKSNYFEALRDLVIGIFHLLEHTPVRLMGINSSVHFDLENKEVWHEFGHKLAPKVIWNQIMSKPGLQSLIINAERADTHKGYIRVKVEPSGKITPCGIYVSVNDHYEASNKEAVEGCFELISLLQTQWEYSINQSISIFNKLAEE